MFLQAVIVLPKSKLPVPPSHLGGAEVAASPPRLSSRRTLSSVPSEVLKNLKKETSPEEIEKIKTTSNLNEQVVFYKKLIERVGPEEAQDALYKSGLPFDGQTHLLNHAIGDILYEKHGPSGLTFCKDYFLSSCYHGFVIHAVADGGVEALREVMATCWKKGPSVAVQCAHAIGHGLLTWVGYANLTEALTKCDYVATISENFPTYNCHDGVFMENIWAVHEDGKPSKDRWVSNTDPVYPCNDPRIDEQYIKACWSNQPMRMYQMFGQDVTPVGVECLKLGNNIYKETCFDSLARQIHPVTNGNPDEVFRLCGLMPQGFETACITSIVRAAFGVGDRELPFSLCERIEETSKISCYQSLGGIIKSYYANSQDGQALCEKITNPKWRNLCNK